MKIGDRFRFKDTAEGYGGLDMKEIHTLLDIQHDCHLKGRDIPGCMDCNGITYKVTGANQYWCHIPENSIPLNWKEIMEGKK